MTRYVTVKIDGFTYQIPDMWLCGATRTFGSAQAAIQQWHEQEQMAQEAR